MSRSIEERQRLAAWVVADGSVSEEELRRHLLSRLPAWMIPDRIVVVEALPRLPNGKVDRSALARLGPLRSESAKPRRSSTGGRESLLAGIFRDVLRIETVGPDDDFFALGGDSILALRLIAKAGGAGLRIAARDVFRHPTVAGLARVATPIDTKAEEDRSEAPPAGEVEALPLTPIQRWFFGLDIPRRSHWNISIALELARPIDPASLDAAARALRARHDAFRFRFARNPAGEWRAALAPPEDDRGLETLRVDLGGFSVSARDDALPALASGLQASLDIERGPVARLVAIDCGNDEPSRLWFIAHHLICDGVSLRVILDEIASGSGGAPRTSFAAWSRKLDDASKRGELDRDLAPWATIDPLRIRALPRDRDLGLGREREARRVRRTLDPERTAALLSRANESHRTRADDILRTALLRVVSAWSGSRSLWIDHETHGREDIVRDAEIDSTVGWFTALAPVLLERSASGALADDLESVREGIRSIPRGGLGFATARWLSGDPAHEALSRLPVPEIYFNYLGRLDLPAGGAFVSIRSDLDASRRDPDAARTHLLEVNAWVAGERLEIEWTYGPSHREETVVGLAEDLERELESWIDHRPSPRAGDFGEIDDTLPLSSLQEGMLFHVRLESGSSVYWNQFIATIRGPLEPETFRSAWDDVASRHAALRTCFVTTDRERPVQVVWSRVCVPWTFDDWRGCSREEIGAQLEDFLARDRASLIDIAAAPLFRCALFRTSSDEHRFVWSQHHLIVDGWSWPIVLREVLELAHAKRNGSELSLPAVRPFSDWVRWAAAQDLGAAQEFWREALAGFETPIAIGAEWSARREAFDASAARRIERSLHSEVSTSLRSRARELRVTPSVFVQAAWARVLAVWGQSEDVVFGLTIATRPPELPGIERTVGPLINTLPLRVSVPKDEDASKTLSRIHERSGDLQRFAWTPLAEAQRVSAVRGGTPLFESILVFENFPFNAAALRDIGGLEITDLRAIEHDNYPLTAMALPTEPFVLRLDFDSRRIRAADAERILGHWARAIEELALDPHRPWREISLLDQAERRRVLVEWNSTERPLAPHPRLDELVLASAERNSERIAVRTKDCSLPYRELVERAHEVAALLRALEVPPGAPVGVALERSIDLVPSLLGVLLHGSPWVPLDPDYPAERLRRMVEDAAPGAVIVHTSVRDRIPLDSPPRMEVDGPRGLVVLACECAGPAAAGLAYVIFTSGSTGRPKGVEVTHRSAVNFLRSMAERPGANEDDVLVAVTSLSFDISLLELFLPLLAGGTVVVANREEAIDGARLARLIDEHRATMLQATPGTWRLLLESEWRGAPGLRALAGGEPLPADLARELLPRVRELWNLYGPTETTVWSTVARVTSPEDITIGRPIANTQVYILDEDLEPLPIGVAGDLWIGGDGVARGYRGRSDLTRASFRPDPFRSQREDLEPSTARIYKTGDVGAWRHDGELLSLGRRDAQVKVRGFRIELGEIESVLAGHAGVRAAAAGVREERPGDPRLVAWIVAADPSPSPEDLREHAARELPEWMVPVAYVFLDQLPRTPNGKIDRNALPAPAGAMLVEHAAVAPATPIEHALLPVWREVLGLEAIGVEDSFFELGGHSILATRLMQRMNLLLHSDLPLRALFEAPTIRAISARYGASGEAASVNERFGERSWGSLLAVQPRGSRPPLYLVAGAHADEDVFLRYLSNLIPYLGLDQPVYGFRARGLDGDEIPHDSVEEMARDYVAELMDLDPRGPYILAGECVGGVVAWEMARRIRDQGGEVSLLLLLDTWRPRPLSKEELATFHRNRRRRRWQTFAGRFQGLAWHAKVVAGAKWAARKLRATLIPSEETRRRRRIRRVETHYPWIIHRYRAGRYGGAVALIANEEDHAREPGLGWSDLARGGISTHLVPGDHISRLTVHAPETARKIRTSIDAVNRASPF